MAVSSFLKSSGIAALAFGLAIALPAAASAQERGWRGGGQQTTEAQQQDGGQARAPRRGRGETRSSPPARSQPQAPQARSRYQGHPLWQGTPGYDAAPPRPDNSAARARQNVQRDTQRPLWQGQNRDNVRRDDRQRDWNNNDRNRWDGNRDQARRDGNRWNNDTRRWNNNWRRNNRYDWSGYRSANRHVFRLGRYNSPYRNWNYRRLGIGFALQPLFYSSSYWINDPWSYRLPEAYGPYRWVRYYDDALLVDIYTGRVVDVINDFFW